MTHHNNDGYYTINPPSPKKSWVEIISNKPLPDKPIRDTINPAIEDDISQNPFVRFSEDYEYESSSSDSEEPTNPLPLLNMQSTDAVRQNPFENNVNEGEYVQSSYAGIEPLNPFDQFSEEDFNASPNGEYSHASNELERRESQNDIYNRFV